jgi:hypothetical protein
MDCERTPRLFRGVLFSGNDQTGDKLTESPLFVKEGAGGVMKIYSITPPNLPFAKGEG